MIVVGLVFVALLSLAFLGAPRNEDGRSSALNVILFALILVGIVARHQKAKEDEDL